MTTIATVSDKGQVTLPKPLRDRLGILPGTRLEFRLGADGILQAKVLPKGSAALAGLLAQPGEVTRTQADQEAAVTAAVLERSKARR
jgi:AbrB family looped-hinge helix DNA binding protein